MAWRTVIVLFPDRLPRTSIGPSPRLRMSLVACSSTFPLPPVMYSSRGFAICRLGQSSSAASSPMQGFGPTGPALPYPPSLWPPAALAASIEAATIAAPTMSAFGSRPRIAESVNKAFGRG